jgi:signal recognition particle GTPase
MGERWHKLLSPGEILNVVDYETESISRIVQVIETDFVPFESISEDMLIYETSGASNKEQLLAEMQDTYEDFDPNGFVSVVTFSV